VTDFIELTEMWQDGKYTDVADAIFMEDWDNERLAKFCSYFVKYLGTKELELLNKFM